jgi:phenylalanyl-tRNA synthetase beta chain
MKVSYNWLKDFVSLDGSAQALADKLTMAGLEVTGCQQKGADWVLEIEVTSNRPDWLSHLGIAREVAAVTAAKLKIPAVYSSQFTVHSQKNKKDLGPVSIKLGDKKGCPLYTALVVDNLVIERAEPYICQRLATLGVRSVNPIVDITNYILLEVSQPMHAFDLDKILKRSPSRPLDFASLASLGTARDSLRSPVEIIVRRAKPGEKITTIDGVERVLNSGVLVIADSLGPIAVAGIMGGKDTEVDASTKRVLLESAYFDPITIRRGRQSLNLNSESSYRFERNVHVPTVINAQARAADLIKAIAPQVRFSQLYQSGSKPAKSEQRVTIEAAEINKILGLKLSAEVVSATLKRLGCSVQIKAKGRMLVGIPDFRADLAIIEDLAEEIARIHGYDKIPLTLPHIDIQTQAGSTATLEHCSQIIKEALCACGFFEVITYSLIKEDKLKNLSGNANVIVPIANPLSREQAVLRTSLLPGLLDAAGHNFNHSQDDVHIFEMGAVFSSKQGGIKEEANLAILSCGNLSSDWSRQAILKEKRVVSFFDVKGALELVLNQLGIDSKRISYKPINEPYYSSLESASVSVDNLDIGSFGKLSSAILDQFDIRKEDIFASFVDLEKLVSFAELKKQYEPFSSFPVVRRDLTFIIKGTISVQSLKDAVKASSAAFLQRIELVDEYRAGNIPKGCRSLSFSFTFTAAERTLKEEEIMRSLQAIKEVLAKNFGATLRES